jgi:hypothetical protein
MSVSVTCVRCGGPVRPPGLAASDWQCVRCGPVQPLHVPDRVGPAVLAAVAAQARRPPQGGAPAPRDRRAGAGPGVPLWCPWPLLPGWLVTGVGWAGDDRSGASATVLACSGPSPLQLGPAELMLIAEVPGVGLGARFAGTQTTNTVGVAAARVTAARHDTPMWALDTPDDRVAYAGEALGIWLYAVAWPSDAGYVLCEDIVLRDITEWLPAELVYGAPSPYLRGGPGKSMHDGPE